MKVRRAAFALVLLVPATAARAGDAPAKPWSASLGLSFLDTTGNSTAASFGTELEVKRTPDPWGVELHATYLRSSKGGVVDAERVFGSLRGTRAIDERWSLFAFASGERDTFAGFDLRGVVGAGGAFKVLAGPRHDLGLDAGLTWTTERLVADGRDDFAGGVLGVAYAWTMSATAKFEQKVRWFPEFQGAAAWRLESDTALQAALTTHLALKAAYAVRYSHRPVAGYRTTDTTSTVSLVASY